VPRQGKLAHHEVHPELRKSSSCHSVGSSESCFKRLTGHIASLSEHITLLLARL